MSLSKHLITGVEKILKVPGHNVPSCVNAARFIAL